MSDLQKMIDFTDARETREQRLRRVLSGRIELSDKDHSFTAEAARDAERRAQAACRRQGGG